MAAIATATVPSLVPMMMRARLRMLMLPPGMLGRGPRAPPVILDSLGAYYDYRCIEAEDAVLCW
jgi:hypothetical protein